MQIRPYLTFFIVSQLSPTFSESQKSLLKRLCFFMWLFFIPIGIFGLMNHTLLYSIFGQPSNYITNISCLSFVYLFCSNFSIRERFTFILMLSAGLLVTNTVFYSIFLLTCGILLYYHHSDILKFNLRTGIALGVIAFIVLHITRVQITTYLFPVDTITTEYDLTTRSALYQTAVDILKDFFPLGSGLASFGTEASGLYYSKIYSQYGLNSINGLTPQEWFSVSDSYYPSLAQFGIIGIILYLLFWGRIVFKSFVTFKQSADIQQFVLILILASFVFIENLSDPFLTSNKGYYMMMFLGVFLGKKKSFSPIHENNKKIVINPIQKNKQEEHTDDKQNAASEKNIFQMPPIPIKEEEMLKKDMAEYSSSHSTEKNETEESITYKDEEEFEEEEFDEYDEEEFEEEADDMDADSKYTDYGETAHIPEHPIQEDDLLVYNPLVDDDDELYDILVTTRKKTGKADASSPSANKMADGKSEEPSIQARSNVAVPTLNEQRIPIESSLIQHDDSQEIAPSSNSLYTDIPSQNNKEVLTEQTEAVSENEKERLPDYAEDLDSMISKAIDNRIIPQDEDVDKFIIEQSQPSPDIADPETIEYHTSNSIRDLNEDDLIVPISTVDTASMESMVKDHLYTVGDGDIENQVFAFQTTLNPSKPESDLVKGYRKMVEEQRLSESTENEAQVTHSKQEADAAGDYIRYIEELLKPIQKENPYTPSHPTGIDGDEESNEQIDYSI